MSELEYLRGQAAALAGEVERYKAGLTEQRSYSAELFAERDTLRAEVAALRECCRVWGKSA